MRERTGENARETLALSAEQMAIATAQTNSKATTVRKNFFIP